MEIWNPGITAKGLDFLEDDGGLSAILGAITVKLDPDDLRALIAARIEESDLPTRTKGFAQPCDGHPIDAGSGGG